jgi:uncharacterized delta-60 repeat protein
MVKRVVRKVVRTTGQRRRAALLVGSVLPLVAVGAALGAARFDSSFGVRGTVFTRTGAAGPDWPINALVRDGKGRLVAVGGANDRFVVARYRPNGRLDKSFGGGDGLAYIGDWAPEDPERQLAAATAVALQRDGKIVVVGFHTIITHAGPTGKRMCWALTRLKPGGGLDTSFGNEGRSLACTKGRDPFAVLIQGGKIIVAGQAPRNTDPANKNVGQVAGRIARFSRDGSIDKSFGARGTGVVSFVSAAGTSSGVLDLALLPSGNILASGYFGWQFMLARLHPNGQLDTSFGRKGRAVTDVDGRRDCPCDIGWGMTRDRRGRIVVTGFVEAPNPRDYIALVRYRQDGSLDRSFGREGIVRTKIGDYAHSRHVAIQNDGRIVVVGASGSPKSSRFTVIRYKPCGKLDRSFFGDGVLARRVGKNSNARDVLIDRAGRLVAAGGAIIGGKKGFLLTRYLPG